MSKQIPLLTNYYKSDSLGFPMDDRRSLLAKTIWILGIGW